jgi:hypothetical protein
MSRPEFCGIDFSGAARAGRKIWIAEGRWDEEQLHVQRVLRAADLPGSGIGRDAALAALREYLRNTGPRVIGLDFPFSLPRCIVGTASWEEFLEQFPSHFPREETFRADCLALTGGKELRRQTDMETKTPFSPLNLWLWRQTFFGIRDVLRPLVLDGSVRVLPMQRKVSGKPLLIEICPASWLKLRGMYSKYKGKQETAREARVYLLDMLKSQQGLVLSCEQTRSACIEDREGDALDSVLALCAAASAASNGFAVEADHTHSDHYTNEGYVYC